MADVSLITSNISGPSAVPSSQASSVFPTLESETINIIDAIIGKVSADSSDWKPLLSAYQDALRLRGLDGSKDTHIYALLLRLAMERGRTWQIKWDNVKRRQLDGEQHATPLARAASDMDVFGTPGHQLKPASHVASTAKHRQTSRQLPLTREALDELQAIATPYKTIAATFLQTARPDHKQDVQRSRRPSPFAASGLGVVQDAADRTLVEEQFAQDGNSPQDSHEAEYLSALFFDATEIDRLATLGKTWDDWLARLTVLSRLRRHTDLARDAVLKRRTLFRWRAHLLFVRKLEQAASGAATTNLLRRCFSKWKNKTEEKQRRAWEKELNSGFKRMTRKRNTSILQRCFARWREASLRSRGRAFQKRSLLSKSWRKWSNKSVRVEEMREQSTTMLEAIDADLLANAMVVWKRKTDYALREASFAEQLDTRVLSDAVKAWRQRLEHVQIADEFCGLRLALGCMARWKFRLHHVRNLQTQALQLSKARDEDTLERTFIVWHVRELGRLLVRTREMRIQRTAIAAWRTRLGLIRQHWQGQAATLREKSDQQLMGRALRTWRARTAQRSSTLRIAASLASRLTLQKSMQDWRARSEHHRRLQHRAIVARAFFVQRTALRAWHSALCLRRQDAWIVEKEHKTVRMYFQAWRARASADQRHRVLLEGISAAIDQRIVSNALQRWTVRVIEIRSRQLEISTTRNTHIMQTALSRWRDRTLRCAEDLTLGDSFRDVQEEDGLRRAFRHWRASARQKRSLQDRYHDYMRDTELNTLAMCMEKWLDQARERMLAEEEARVVNYRQHQALKTTFRQWQRVTIVLPAIRFDNDRLRRLFIGRWRAKLPLQTNHNDACEYDRTRLLGAALSSWREAVKARTARRAANRFRAFATRQQHTPARHSKPTQAPASKPSNISSRLHRLQITAASPAASPGYIQPASSRPLASSPHPPTTSTPRPLHTSRSSMLTPGTVNATTLRRELGRTPNGQTQAVLTPRSPISPASVALPPSSTASAVSSARGGRDSDVFRDIRDRLAGGARS